MPLIETEGIVLRVFNIGEADRVVSVLTRESGRVRVRAAGARGRRSRFGSSLEPLTYLRIWFYERENRDLFRLNSTEIVESFAEMQKEYRVHLAAQYVAEVCERFLPERESNDRVFRLILHVLRSLKRSGNLDAMLVYFDYWMLRLGGLLVDLERCSLCSRSFGEQNGYYCEDWEGLRCSSCREKRGRDLTPTARGLCAQAQGLPLDRWLTSISGPDQARGLRQFLDGQIEGYIERKLVTKNLLDEVLCG